MQSSIYLPHNGSDNIVRKILKISIAYPAIFYRNYSIMTISICCNCSHISLRKLHLNNVEGLGEVSWSNHHKSIYINPCVRIWDKNDSNGNGRNQNRYQNSVFSDCKDFASTDFFKFNLATKCERNDTE